MQKAKGRAINGDIVHTSSASGDESLTHMLIPLLPPPVMSRPPTSYN